MLPRQGEMCENTPFTRKCTLEPSRTLERVTTDAKNPAEIFALWYNFMVYFYTTDKSYNQVIQGFLDTMPGW